MAPKTKGNGAIFSHYRYQLWRVWDEQKPLVMFIGLNPSNGDGETDDPTLRKLIAFVQNLENGKYGGFYIGNLFAFVASKPNDLLKSKQPVGEDNDLHLKEMAAKCKEIISMWGDYGVLHRRDKEVMNLFPDRNLLCFGVTNDGRNPVHPANPRLRSEKLALSDYRII